MSLGSITISWRSHKQSIPVDSTTEAEYVAATQATQEIIWLRKILEDLQEKQKASTSLLTDNSSAIQLAKNPKFHDRSKHINTKYHLIRHYVEAKVIHMTVLLHRRSQTYLQSHWDMKSLKNSKCYSACQMSLWIKGGMLTNPSGLLLYIV